MLVVTEKKEPNKKQNYSGYHLYCMETKNTLKRCYIFVIPNDAIQYDTRK